MCGKPAVHRIVQKEGPNKDRQFYACEHSKDHGGCGYFMWESQIKPKTKWQQTHEEDSGSVQSTKKARTSDDSQHSSRSHVTSPSSQTGTQERKPTNFMHESGEALILQTTTSQEEINKLLDELNSSSSSGTGFSAEKAAALRELLRSAYLLSEILYNKALHK